MSLHDKRAHIRSVVYAVKSAPTNPPPPPIIITLYEGEGAKAPVFLGLNYVLIAIIIIM